MKAQNQITNVMNSIKDKYLLACVMATLAHSAHAAPEDSGSGTFTVAGFTDLGCGIIKWIAGDLATMIFFVVVILTIVVGFFAKMDWSKILAVVILMGILKGIPTMLDSMASVNTLCGFS